MHELTALFIAEAVDTFCDVIAGSLDDIEIPEETKDSMRIIANIFEHPEVIADLIHIFEINEHKKFKFKIQKQGRIKSLKLDFSKRTRATLSFLREVQKEMADSPLVMRGNTPITKH